MNRLSIRDMLMLLNERYRVLSQDIIANNSKMDSYIREQNNMRLDMERIKTSMKIYIAIAVFLASVAASIITSLIIKQ